MPVTGQTNNLNNSPLATTISASIYLSHTNKRNNHIQIREEVANTKQRVVGTRNVLVTKPQNKHHQLIKKFC